ncbi:MAG: alpha/beta hydrolase-fold protein [Gemmataceae bacterium]|nr:alpha/beta hydrolase-fold protein [Gemmataceae bacterium]
MVRTTVGLLTTVVVTSCWSITTAQAQLGRFAKRTPVLEDRFHGQVLDFTCNHGVDRRIEAPSLGEKRDLYVYLPPRYDPAKKYPFIFWLHGIEQDEKGFLEHGLPQVDDAIACGKLVPAIIAIPDGSLRGRPGYFSPNSGFLNSRAGHFEDFLFNDVYDFIRRNFAIRPERQAHVLAGVSIGGGAAFHHGIVRRSEFGVVVGFFPPLNLRWRGCHGGYFANFDPDTWCWREHYHLGLRPVGKFYCGLVSVPWRRLVHPLYGHGNEVVPQLARDNPIELLDAYDVKEGELAMLIAYGGRDQFNIDAQVESFLERARQRGLTVHVIHEPSGRHDVRTALAMLPAAIGWLTGQLESFRVK